MNSRTRYAIEILKSVEHHEGTLFDITYILIFNRCICTSIIFCIYILVIKALEAQHTHTHTNTVSRGGLHGAIMIK